MAACSNAPPPSLPSTGFGSTTQLRDTLRHFSWVVAISGCRAATCLLVLRTAIRCSMFQAPPHSPMCWDALYAAGEDTEFVFPVVLLAVSRDATFEAPAEAVASILRTPAPPLSCPAIRSATAFGGCTSRMMWTLPGPWARATSSPTAPMVMWWIGASPLLFLHRDLPHLPSRLSSRIAPL